MKRVFPLFLLLLIGLPTFSLAGDIQVLCEPGLRVFLDGEFMGVSNAKEDGLFLPNVPIGEHVIRIEKDGFLPQSFTVQIGLPLEVRVGEFMTEPESPQVEEAPPVKVGRSVGSLLITSAPQNCVVEIDGRSVTKDGPYLSIDDLAAGEHTISFSKPGYDPLSDVVRVAAGAEVAVRGNFKTGKVESVHEGKGSLRVISTPMSCTVRFLGKIREKNDPRLNLSQIPAGEHRIEVSWGGRKLSTKIWIIDGHRTVVTVSFKKGDEPFVVSHEPK
jgi:hypothetical protein